TVCVIPASVNEVRAGVAPFAFLATRRPPAIDPSVGPHILEAPRARGTLRARADRAAVPDLPNRRARDDPPSTTLSRITSRERVSDPVAELVRGRVDDQHPGVDGAVTTRTQPDEVLVVCRAAVCPEHDMMNV